jgi:hypothetical protein
LLVTYKKKDFVHKKWKKTDLWEIWFYYTIQKSGKTGSKLLMRMNKTDQE